MIGPEEIEHTSKKNPTPMIVLGAAALLLLIVGFISYRDYINSKADERIRASDERIAELTRKINELSQRNTPSPGSPAAPGSPSNNATGPAGSQRQPAAPATDPEIEALRRELAEIRKRHEETDLKVDRILDEPPPGSGTDFSSGLPGGNEVAALPPPRIRDDHAPAFVREDPAPSQTGNLSPEAEKRLTALQQKVRNAPALGSITSYDSEWGFVTFNAGSSQGVAKDKRFSIRRGSEVLGIVKVSQVFPTESIATIVTKNIDYDGALKPQPGDEIIAFDPF